MTYKDIFVDSALKQILKKDNLFLGKYTIDPYQNCSFGCIYCDSSFDSDIFVKRNITEILDKELKKLPKGRIIIGSVHDPYQKAEEKFELTKNIINTIKKNNFSCHILTKSDLILRDIELLKDIKDCIVTISILSASKKISSAFEKNVISPDKRFKLVKKLNNEAIKCGIALIPVLPYFIDSELESILLNAEKYEAKYLIHKHLELKGDQKQIFFKNLETNFTAKLKNYKQLYKDSYLPDKAFIDTFNAKINKMISKYNLKNKI